MRTITSISAAAILLRSPEFMEIGVCNNLDMSGAELKEMLAACRRLKWYSGDTAYPVEGSHEAYQTIGKWKGERGEKRRQLCGIIRDMSPYKDNDLFMASAHLVGILWHGPLNEKLGVCVNVPTDIDFDEYADYSKFPGFTGDIGYPIECKAMYTMSGKWEGERRKRRMAFCRFLLGEFLAKMENPT